MKDHLIEPEQTPSNEGVEPRQVVLRATGIQRAYSAPAGRLEVLRGVDLSVTRGMVLAIVGVSGVGKSTLLNILGTLDRPDAGSIEIRGRRVEEMNERDLAVFRARHLGFVFQFHHLLPEFNAEENVMMPLLIAGESPSAAQLRAREALAAVGLKERWEHSPSQLSGGEAQRVAVAMLSKRGHSVHVVENGRDALEAVFAEDAGDRAAARCNRGWPRRLGFACSPSRDFPRPSARSPRIAIALSAGQ